MSEKNQKNLLVFMNKIGYLFKNNALLKQALTHRSVPRNNNERLEFLGDAILSFIIASSLYKQYPKVREGELSRIRAHLVNEEMLAKIALELNLPQWLRLGVGELKSGGMLRSSILADAMEAIIAAIYLDSDIVTCEERVLEWYQPYLKKIDIQESFKDAKSKLQEWLQSRQMQLPIYEVQISGKPHEQVFYVICRVHGLAFVGEGRSTSRRKAEQKAAQHLLELIEHAK